MEGFVVADDWIGALSPPVRRAVAAEMQLRAIPAGGELVRAGSMADHVFRLRNGFLKQTGLQEDGECTLVTIYGPGACFAETAVIVDAPLNHTTVALTSSVVECLPTPVFWRLYRAHGEIPDALCRKFAHAVRRAVTIRETSASVRLNTRLELLFAGLAHNCGAVEPNGLHRINIPFTQIDLAQHLGVTRQSIQRELASLKLAGSVSRQTGGWLVDHSRMSTTSSNFAV